MAGKAKLMLAPLLFSLLPFSSLALSQDFCVADLHRPDTPAGYPCKDTNHVDADDFHSTALAKSGPIIPPFNTGLASANVKQWPAVNGIHLGFSRVDVLPGGVVPIHAHPRASEVIYVTEGSMVAGFISADANKVYMKKVNKGELFLFPQGLMHFQYNPGNTTAVAIGSTSSPNPSVQVADYALFANNLPAEDVSKVTFIKTVEVIKLKALFGPRSIEG